jgi:hypothetical protein
MDELRTQFLTANPGIHHQSRGHFPVDVDWRTVKDFFDPSWEIVDMNSASDHHFRIQTDLREFRSLAFSLFLTDPERLFIHCCDQLNNSRGCALFVWWFDLEHCLMGIFEQTWKHENMKTWKYENMKTWKCGAIFTIWQIYETVSQCRPLN